MPPAGEAESSADHGLSTAPANTLIQLPDDYRDSPAPSPDELARLAWEVGGGALPFEQLDAVERERWHAIGEAVFEAGMVYENRRILARLERMRRA